MGFVLAALKAIGCPSVFIGWIEQCITTPSFSIAVNGSVSGFFHSAKGLRQGDPLSPYLFVLAMEVLSRLLSYNFNAGYIAYRPRTEELEISHLMFADDIMIFFDGGESSLHGITEVLEAFSSWSGLQMNQAKTQLFSSGMSQKECLAISRFRFTNGSLPIRYLGLLLMSRRLKISEYADLLDKVTRRFKSWGAKTLIFAGRVELIRTVISGLVNFWISTFILPKGCIRRLEKLCSRFLWTGDVESGHGTKVAWVTCCLPKEEGGLGLKRFTTWNSVLSLRYFWLLVSDSQSLWVKWHKHHHIKDSSVWLMEQNPSYPWTWNALLSLKHLAERFVSYTVNNGLETKFWFDSWTLFGNLLKYIGEGGPRQLRIPLHSTVSEVCSDGYWKLPSPRSDNALSLHIYLTTIPVPKPQDGNDSVHWQVNDSACSAYSASKTWDALR